MRKSVLIVLLATGSGPLCAQETGTPQPLNRADFISEMDTEFARMDANGDNVLTPEEISSAQEMAMRAEALRQNRRAFDRLDTDQNGLIDADEFAGLMDLDQVAINPAPFLEQFDSNSDQAITLLEYRIVTQQNFDRIDSDRDGVVSPEEMNSAGIEPSGR